MLKKRYSGRITVRTSHTIHKKLIEKADREGVSLNLFVNNLMVAGVASSTKKTRKTRKKG